MSLFDEARRQRESTDAWAREIAREAQARLRARASCEPEQAVWNDHRTRIADRALILEHGELRPGGTLSLYQPRKVWPGKHPDGTVPPTHMEPADFVIPKHGTKPALASPKQEPGPDRPRERDPMDVRFQQRQQREYAADQRCARAVAEFLGRQDPTIRKTVDHNPGKHVSQTANPLFRAKQRADRIAREDAQMEREDKALAAIEAFIRGVFAS